MKHYIVVAIATLFGLIPGPAAPIKADPIVWPTFPRPVLLKPLETPNLQPQELLQPVYIPPPTYTAGGNTMRDYIFSVESGGRLDAVNPGGCIGLGQDCNGWLITGRLNSPACPNWRTDLNCQLAYWDWYANSVYGGWAQAYAFRLGHNYW